VIAFEEHADKAIEPLQQSIDKLRALRSTIDIITKKNQRSMTTVRSLGARLDPAPELFEQVAPTMYVPDRNNQVIRRNARTQHRRFRRRRARNQTPEPLTPGRHLLSDLSNPEETSMMPAQVP
jgi:hypothetical protein